MLEFRHHLPAHQMDLTCSFGSSVPPSICKCHGAVATTRSLRGCTRPRPRGQDTHLPLCCRPPAPCLLGPTARTGWGGTGQPPTHPSSSRDKTQPNRQILLPPTGTRQSKLSPGSLQPRGATRGCKGGNSWQAASAAFMNAEITPFAGSPPSSAL